MGERKKRRERREGRRDVREPKERTTVTVAGEAVLSNWW